MSNIKIPDGLRKCEVCDEYKGSVMEKDLNWEGFSDKENRERSERYLTVSCLCDGILCGTCKQNKIHRPTSNSYYEENNCIEHSPYFVGMMPCGECRKKTSSVLQNNHQNEQ
jgi:hypothetical protein